MALKPVQELHVLRRAIALLGSQQALASRLRVPEGDVRLWLKGQVWPSRSAFLGATDVLIEFGESGEPPHG